MGGSRREDLTINGYIRAHDHRADEPDRFGDEQPFCCDCPHCACSIGVPAADMVCLECTSGDHILTITAEDEP